MNGNAAAAGSGSVIYAIGDVHGCDALLARMHALIRDHRAGHYPGRDAVLLHLGDYVDRGSDSRAVIDRVRAGLDGFRSVCLMGNHEAMMLDCLDQADSLCWARWLSNGAAETLASFGLSAEPGATAPARLRAALGPERIAWLRGLRLDWRAGGHLFVHAGIRPGVPLEAQQPQDLLWIRDRFLDSTADHGVTVVHGHTPVAAPERRPNRIGLDTGAVYSGVLSAAALAPGAEPVFLQVSEGSGAG